jgi:hypothetical protein
MKSSTKTRSPRSHSTQRGAAAPRALLVVAGVVVALAAALLAMFGRGAPRPPDDAAPGREAARQPSPSPIERAPAPQPALPQPPHTTPAERPSARAETKIVVTQMRVQKYVDEAYPAWRHAHPGKECPGHLTELTEYTDDKDTNDAWGRPLRMVCGPTPQSSATHIKVISYGRDAEVSEDDIKFEQ